MDIKSRSLLEKITPVILTLNEEANISRVLDKLHWAKEIIVVDSGSSDATLQLLTAYHNVRCLHRKFDSHHEQWNFAINQVSLGSDWILALDADYVLTDELINEISDLSPEDDVMGYRARFQFYLRGQHLRGALYTPVVTLYRRGKGHYIQTGHTQRLQLNGIIINLQGYINHDDRKSLSRWLLSQDRYTTLEANYLLSNDWSTLKIQDRIRRMMFIAPWLMPLYFLIFRAGIRDGWLGFFYALQRNIAESLLLLKIIELRLSKRMTKARSMISNSENAKEN